MSALEICPVIWRTGRSWQCSEKGTISFLTWEESPWRGQLPGAPGCQLWDWANNFQRELGPGLSSPDGSLQGGGPHSGGLWKELSWRQGQALTMRNPSDTNWGTAIPEGERSKLLSPPSRTLSLRALSRLARTSFDVNSYKYTGNNLACVSFFGKSDYTNYWHFWMWVIILKHLRWTLFYLLREAAILCTYGTVLMRFQEYNLSNFGCFPLMYVISSLLTWVTALANSAATSPCSHHFLNFSLKQISRKSKYKTHKVGFTSNSYNFLSMFVLQKKSKKYDFSRTFILVFLRL